MNPENIVITGGNGQLGKALQQKYPGARAVDIEELDISDEQQVNDYDWANTKLLINAAAYTNVDGAETAEGQEIAQKVNTDAVTNLARIAIKNEIVLVHISTDYVFDGTKTNHGEDEPFSPISTYGRTKADGDKAAALAPAHYILRTSWVIGDGKNFVRTMLNVGKQAIDPSVVSDQIGRLTFTNTLVDAIDHLLSVQAPYGTYNVSNEGDPVSWADLTRQIYKYAGLPNEVKDITTQEYFAGKTNIAPRPLQSTLDLGKIESTGFRPNNWQDDLKKYVDKELIK